MLVATLVALSCAGVARAQTQQVYSTSPSAAQSGTSQINGFAKNAQTGSLASLPTSPTNERLDGATLAVDALGRFLFVLNPMHDDISMFQIDSSTGALTEVPASPFAVGPFLNPQQAPTQPNSLATEPSGHYLYVGFYGGSFYSNNNPETLDGAINAFLINPQGSNGPTLQPLPVPEIDLPGIPPVPHGLATDAHGRNVYVAYGSGQGSTPSGIGILKIDPNTGLLTFPFDGVSQGQHGRAMAIDPQARFIYLAHGEDDGQVSGWPLSPVDGTAGVAINEVIYGIGQFPATMVEESSGRYLYVWVLFGGLHVYSINQTTGSLTEVTGSPLTLGGTPTGAAADPLGAFLFLADGQGVHVLSINLSTGLPNEIAGSPFSATAGLGIAVTGSTSGSALSGPLPQFDTTQINFPDTVDGKTFVFNDRMANNGQQPLLINVAAIPASPGAGFSQTNDCPVSLGAGLFCTFSITFAPTGAVPYQATLNIPDNGPGGQQSIGLMGNGIAPPPPTPAIGLSVTELDFSTSGLGQTNTQKLTVLSTGTSPLTVTGVQFSGANVSDFSVPNGDNGCTAPVAPNASCIITVQFAPQALGLRTAMLQVNSNGGSPPPVTLNGIAAFVVSSAVSSSMTQTVAPGSTAQFSLLVTPAQGLSGVAQLQCTGAPQGATCIAPLTVTLSPGNSTGFAVMVTTTGMNSGAAPPVAWPRAVPPPIDPLLAGILSMLACFALVKRRSSAPGARRAARSAFAAAALLAIALAGCGTPSSSSNSSGPSATPSGTYTLTLTLTSGTDIETVNLTLKVQ